MVLAHHATGAQVISPREASGVVEVVEGLSEVQDKTYSQPTVLVANQVGRWGRRWWWW